MKIAVYASARNEEKNLDDWLATVADADHIAINDTGSTDHTYERLTAINWKRLHTTQLPVEPMLLANALNVALAELPDDIDLAVRLDLDERLQPGWRDNLERLEIDGPTIIRPWFDHHGCTYRHTRIHTRHGFRWELPVHEILVADSPFTTVDTDITIEHHQDLTKDRSQVLGELQDAYAADPTNERLQHYLAREYTYRGDWLAALPLLRAHATSNAIPEERSESWRLLGNIYTDNLNMPPEDVPLAPYRHAAGTCPERREGWVALAQLCHLQGRWHECLDAAERALAITDQSWYFNHPFAWGGLPWHLAALASSKLGHHDDAARYGAQAVELEPDNELYRANLDWYGRALADIY